MSLPLLLRKVTWEEAKKFDIGLDFNAFDRFSFTFDWFYDKRYNQLVKRNDIPQILGVGTSPINVARTSNMGFGGVGESGMGSYHGRVGFETFSHYRSIVDKKTWMDLPIRYQKYTGLKEKMMRMFLK